MGLSFILNLTSLPEKVLKETEKQGQAVVNEVVSELGGSPQKAEPPPADAEGTKDFVRRMYAPQNSIDENSIRQIQQQEENIPFNIEAIRAKIAGKEPPEAKKKQDVARQHGEYFNATFETPPQPAQQPQHPEQPQPLKSSHEHTSSVALESDPTLPGTKGRKAMRNRMQANILRRKTATASAELGKNQGHG